VESEGVLEAVDGHHVNYSFLQGSGDEVVVFCHGIAMDRNEFADVFKQVSEHLLDEGLSSVRFDFRGHGESSMTDLQIDVSGMVLDLETVLKECSGDIHLVCSSFGAVPAILAAREHDVDGITLICPLLDTRKQYFEPHQHSFWDNNREELELEGYIEREDGFRMSASLLMDLRNLRIPHVFGELECEIQLFQAEEDSAVSPQIAIDLGQKEPNVKFHLMENTGHGLVDLDEAGDSPGPKTRKNWSAVAESIAGSL
jgi:hypothetical protein